ncbi:MAG: type II TA system antitoxin MqsA family protein [Bacteroidota bacterium]
MNCPICNSHSVKELKEHRERLFRKESFQIIELFYKCENCSEEYTTTALDQINISLVHNEYRVRNKIPFPEEIKAIRLQYELSAVKMSEILGLGINSYRNYENGEIPSESNARLIQLAADPAEFNKLLHFARNIQPDEIKALEYKIEQLLQIQTARKERPDTQDFVLSKLRSIMPDSLIIPNEFTGYKRPSIDRLGQMVLYFAEKIQPRKTRLNKLLFYSDFLCFKLYGYSMSGFPYRAINYGPVPEKYDTVFEHLESECIIRRNVEVIEGAETVMEQFCPGKIDFNNELFDEKEIKVLDHIIATIGQLNTKDIVLKSHDEEAWKQCNGEKKIISYKEYAFDLTLN